MENGVEQCEKSTMNCLVPLLIIYIILFISRESIALSYIFVDLHLTHENVYIYIRNYFILVRLRTILSLYNRRIFRLYVNKWRLLDDRGCRGNQSLFHYVNLFVRETNDVTMIRVRYGYLVEGIVVGECLRVDFISHRDQAHDNVSDPLIVFKFTSGR